jgi:hypothetical protein
MKKKKNEKWYWSIKLISENGIGVEGAAKLGDGVSKFIILTCLNLNFR